MFRNEVNEVVLMYMTTQIAAGMSYLGKLVLLMLIIIKKRSPVSTIAPEQMLFNYVTVFL
jgi:hypothetical protein